MKPRFLFLMAKTTKQYETIKRKTKSELIQIPYFLEVPVKNFFRIINRKKEFRINFYVWFLCYCKNIQANNDCPDWPAKTYTDNLHSGKKNKKQGRGKTRSKLLWEIKEEVWYSAGKESIHIAITSRRNREVFFLKTTMNKSCQQLNLSTHLATNGQ